MSAARAAAVAPTSPVACSMGDIGTSGHGVCFGVRMATCNLCSRDVPDHEIEAHRRTVHPEIAADGTRESDGSVIVAEVTTQSVRQPHAPEDV
jgi:hypothetical protein